MTTRSVESPASTEPLLDLVDVSVEFRIGGRQRLVAVNGVNLSVRAGDALGLIGESGSGKSTLARAVVGLAPLAGGDIRWDGQSLKTMSRAARRRFSEDVQMVFQDPHSALDPRRTILQSVREPLDVMGRGSRDKRRQLALDALERVGLGAQHASRYPHQLSGGQKQRVNIARALITDPRVLICDESVAALDVALQAEILNLLQDLRRELNLTMLFISHDLDVVSHVADRICVMYLGEVVEHADAQALMSRPLHPYTESLIDAAPRTDAFARNDESRIVLAGDIPSPIAPPSGCRFHTRCPHAAARCSTTLAPLTTCAPSHDSACLRVEDLYGLRPQETAPDKTLRRVL